MNLNRIVAAVGLAFLVGCDYTVALVKTPEIPMDAALLGAWSRTDGNENDRSQRLLVLPLGPNEYLASFPAGEKDALFARVCLCRANERTLAQLTWFGTAQGVIPNDARVFQYAAFSVKDNALQVSLLNADVVARDAASAEALVKAIAASKDNPELFRAAMTFKKVKPPEDPDAPVARPPTPPGWR